MLAATDLQTLTAWCRQRTMSWQALRVDVAATTLVLEPARPARPWQRMCLRAGEWGYMLEDEAGQTLARASDLPALLDALDGGVADAVAVTRPSTPAPAAVFA